ncbi:MAG: hypothetical protein K0R57_4098 [Paenibacillaceae bacterium]|nr:hypothetical protein [Paenibacillaceae bacterium]
MILEQSRSIPVVDEVDICVLGGSCTGVSAAVRAARLGAKVAIVEKMNCFGGNATLGLVCIWHSLYDAEFKKQIIAGTTQEIVERLKRRKHAVEERLSTTPPARMANIMAYYLNTEELKIELDEMILEAGVKPYLHTSYVAPYVEDGELKAVFIENKSGRQAIKAKQFIDATADGDLCVHLGLESYRSEGQQPATACARIYGYSRIPSAPAIISEHRQECRMVDMGYESHIPGVPEVQFWAKSSVYKDCSIGHELTQAEIEGRRQIRAQMDVLRKYAEGGEEIALLSLASSIGTRQTRQIRCRYQLSNGDIMTGRSFPDAIANGSYPSDIHYADKPGVTYYYLDGVQVDIITGYSETRWRPQTETNPAFWQIPYGSLVPGTYPNLLVCGRAIDADPGAFGAIRVMVNTNQTGEAAGVAAFEALTSGRAVEDVDVAAVRNKLQAGGSIIL